MGYEWVEFRDRWGEPFYWRLDWVEEDEDESSGATFIDLGDIQWSYTIGHHNSDTWQPIEVKY